MIVADTHAIIWWSAATTELSRTARAAMDADRVGVPSIVLLEVSMLASRGRVGLPSAADEWLSDLLALPNVELLQINVPIAVTAAGLWNTIHDPTDQLVVATALHHGVPLVTKDGRIRSANVVETIW